MPSVDRDMEEIVDFCKRFSNILSEIEGKAQTLNKLGGQIESALFNTKFATKASATVSETGRKVLAAAQQGEERIRQLERINEQRIAQRDEFER